MWYVIYAGGKNEQKTVCKGAWECKKGESSQKIYRNRHGFFRQKRNTASGNPVSGIWERNGMWYVLQVKTGQETDIVRQCRGRIIRENEDVFTMYGEKKCRFRGEWKLKRYLLFPGYVFIETIDIDDFRIRLHEIKAMTKVLKTGEDVVPVWPEEEEFLRQLGGENHIAGYSEGYLEGEHLVVIDGAMQGYEGKVKRLDRHHRLVTIEVPLLGHLVEVQLGLGVVKRVGNRELQ